MLSGGLIPEEILLVHCLEVRNPVSLKAIDIYPQSRLDLIPLVCFELGQDLYFRHFWENYQKRSIPLNPFSQRSSFFHLLVIPVHCCIIANQPHLNLINLYCHIRMVALTLKSWLQSHTLTRPCNHNMKKLFKKNRHFTWGRLTWGQFSKSSTGTSVHCTGNLSNCSSLFSSLFS